MISVLSFILGGIFLWIGGDFLVRHAIIIGQRFKLSPLIIGLTIVSFGTSAPELIINVFAALGNKPDIVFGNIMGSNIANSLLILGISGMIYPIVLSTKLNLECGYHTLIMGTCVVLLLCIPPVFSLTLWKGLGLLGIFIRFLWVSFDRTSYDTPLSESNTSRLAYPIFMVILGCIMLPIGGNLMISSTITLAQLWDIPEGIIALFAIGIGTSLPELAASVVASVKHNNDIVIGNIIGSNIFNVGFILSISGILAPLPLSDALRPTVYLFLGVSLLLGLSIYLKQRFQKKTASFSRIESSVLLVLYGIFIAVNIN